MFVDNFIPALDETELKDGTMKLVNVAGKEILLVRINNEVFGVSHICPCRKCDLSKGKLEGYIITCPCHGWKFDVRTGEYLGTKENLLITYKGKIEKGKIYVEIF